MAASSAPAPERMPRWGRQGTLFQFRNPAFWVYASIVAATAIVAIGQQRAFRDISPSGWLLSWVLLAIYALPVFLVIYGLDLYEREPLSLVLGAFVWGAVAATTLAGLANQGWGSVVARVGGPEFASRWTAALTAPFVEETLKAAGIVLLAMIATDEFDDMLDGFVYGAVCGLGFTVVEDVFYFVAVFGGTPGGVLEGFSVRVLSSGLYGHVLYTSLAGMGIAYFVSRRGESSLRRRSLVAAGLFLLSIGGHFLWNSPLLDLFPARMGSLGSWLMLPIAAAVKGLPLLLVVVAMVKLARRRERRWLEHALRSEVGSVGLSATELGLLLDPVARRRSRRDMRTRAGERGARLLRRLQREQINLAMVRTRVTSEDDPALVRQREYCKSLRDALAAIPGAQAAERASAGPLYPGQTLPPPPD